MSLHAQAQAGADCVSPSDMMDGRVGAIRCGNPHAPVAALLACFDAALVQTVFATKPLLSAS